MSQDANAGLTADANGSSTSSGDRMATSSRWSGQSYPIKLELMPASG